VSQELTVEKVKHLQDTYKKLCNTEIELTTEISVLSKQIEDVSLLQEEVRSLKQQLSILSQNLGNFNIPSIEKEYDRLLKLKGQHELLIEQLNQLQSQFNNYVVKLELYEETVDFLTKVNEVLKTEMITYLEDLVTKALKEISPFEFKIEAVSSKSSFGYKFYLYDSTTNTYFDIIHSFGGGIKDLISTVLRIAVIILAKNNGPIILDETGKFISSSYQQLFGQFLAQLSKQLDRQIILVSHQENVISAANKTIVCKLFDNTTVIDEI